ncbi:cystathionine beta-lyase [Virgibacillus phasianinus]|uniref:cysteine-S-conjugate beta-lyase n=1 Tax=Virgibacillus phasianinus TaxID=2017483 RepID=A0A220U3Y7_9BACI|nr:MalY/PatB family protein [Virgibacillus phasianinus]ASK62878.1 cystathionine beta-lyase [Virgibacillus phasianinus]
MLNFTDVHNRKDTRSVKWDILQDVFQSNDVLPMWVADMDFQTPQPVIDALVKRSKHGIFGYTILDNDVKDSIANWLKRRHNWSIQTDWLAFSPGVVASLHMAVQAFTEPSDKILIQTPVYTPFYNVIKKHNREVVKSPLKYSDNTYQIDFEDFEKKLKNGVKAFVLCSPHNPVGRVWQRDELKKMADLCVAYDVLIISDEIHGDLTFPGNKHIPIATLSEEINQQTITFMSPSKTFNLAGLQASYIVMADEKKRATLTEQLESQGHHMLNTMGNIALETAYNHGDDWLDELRNILQEHRDYVVAMFDQHAKQLKVIQSEGTYLLWIDCSALGLDDKSLKKFMIEQARVGMNAGIEYGEEGSQFMRMNIACPKATLEEGVNRIINAVK